MILPTQNIADLTSLFSLENGLEGNAIAAAADSVEFQEKDGKKIARIQYDENTEYWVMKASDKFFFSIKEEDAFSYYSMGKDGMVTIISEEDFYMHTSLRFGEDGLSSQMNMYIQENGTEMSTEIISGKNATYEQQTEIKKQGKKVGNVEVKIDEKGRVSSRGYSEDTAFQYKGRFLTGDEITPGKLFDYRVENCIILDEGAIWDVKNGEPSLVGILSEASQSSCKKMKIGGQEFSYQPVALMTEEDIKRATENFEEKSDKKVLAYQSGETVLDGGNVLGSELKNQRGGIGYNPIVSARSIRFNNAADARKSSLDKEKTTEVKNHTNHGVAFTPQGREG